MTVSRARGQQTALITGASGGIGLELARRFSAHDFDLIVVARRATELEALAKECREKHDTEVHVFPMDLLAPNASAELLQQIEEADLAVDVLVNNAGLMDMGDFVEIDVETHEHLIQLNIAVLTSLTRRLLPAMVARGEGRILNLASTSSFQPVPTMALYAASKAFVLSLSEALAEELKGSGVTVTALCPGVTKTDMFDRAQAQQATARAVPEIFLSEAADVAREGYEGCMAGRSVVIPGLPNRLVANIAQLAPRSLLWAANDLAKRFAGN
jgi:short-subunit dehydrogenase